MPDSNRNPQVKGRVRVVREEGYCFVEPLEALPPGYILPRGRDIFLHRSANGGTLPSIDATGTFTIENSSRGGIQAIAVTWDEVRSFIHPYNFVSLPASGLGKAAEVQPFQRRGYISHERYDPQRHSGHIDCTLKTHTHWFIPHADKSTVVPGNDPHKVSQHKVMGYFTLDAVANWSHADPAQDSTRPAIPAASLRGMVRAVFEAATLSCLSVFDPGRLDFRIGYDLEQTPRNCTIPPGRGYARYIPARLLEDAAREPYLVQVLDGRGPDDPANTLRTALIHAYEPRVMTRERRTDTQKAGKETALWQNLGGLPDGSAVAALLPLRPMRHHSDRFYYREAHTVVPARCMEELQLSIEMLEHGSQQPDTLLVFGYLHRTGPNIENKHHERLFFRWDADYNGASAEGSMPERYARFLQDTVPSLTVKEGVSAATRLSLQGYAERHAEKIGQDRATPRRLRAQPIPPYPNPSDFVQEHPAEVTLQAGDLCYALVEDAGGRPIVWGLYPVAMPRLSHDHARGALLHRDFHPCHNPATLCPACRVFGWVRDEPGLRPDPIRVDAVAGHVRFIHAVLRGAWSIDTQRPEQVTLALLDSPKPTTTEFYLRPRADWQQAQQQRWPAAVQTEQRLIYRQEEAVLRGRKYYRRRQVVQPQSEEPAQNGLRRPHDTQDSQNQTVHLLPSDMEFGFRVYFDNLDHAELGALLFSLSLQPPEAWNRHGVQLRHALGHGKPLGMGACDIRIDTLQLEDLTLTSPRHRDAQVPTYAALPPLHAVPLPSETTKWQELVRQFGHAWQRAETLERALQTTREDLLELLRLDPPDGPMHYPPNPSGDHEENYSWFMQNRRGRREGRGPQTLRRQGLHSRLPGPHDERDPQHRLPIDPTSP